VISPKGDVMRLVREVLEALKISDALTVGEILHAKGVYTTPQSARVNGQKQLNLLADQGAIERVGGFYRTLGCKSEYKEHSQLITKTLAEVLKLEVQSTIFREITIPEVGLRPDAICLITKDNQGLCLILEVCNNETPEYLQSKINVWENWTGDTQFLSQLFKYNIPHYEIIPVTVLDGFKSFLEEAVCVSSEQ
jgi:hypothetical protein